MNEKVKKMKRAFRIEMLTRDMSVSELAKQLDVKPNTIHVAIQRNFKRGVVFEWLKKNVDITKIV